MKTRMFPALWLVVMVASFPSAKAADPVVPVGPGAAADDPYSESGGDETGNAEDLPVSGENPLDNADDLPPPSVGGGAAKGSSVAPVAEPYLPAQGSTPPQYYTPQSQQQPLPVVGAETGGVPGMVGYGTDFYRDTTMDRPSFQLFLGPAMKTYPTVLVPDAAPGASVGISLRVMRLGETVFLHGLGSVSWFRVGPVKDFTNVRDVTYHVGGLLEFAVGRRFSLFGAVVRRWNDISSDTHPAMVMTNPAFPARTQLANIGEEARLKIGIGAQWDFHVIPHGSLGARIYGERDYALLSLVMALEPAPRKRLSLNYRNLE